MTTIDKCRKFYIDEVKPMIHKEFDEYENKIAVGVVGEGSECFGFDDEISKDHDFGVGVCLWLTDDDFKSIGSELNAAYCNLLAEIGEQYKGSLLEHRRGAQRISEFYSKIIGFDFDINTPCLTDAQWLYAEDWKLATLVNGEVFRDDLGQFNAVRRMIEGYYPDKVFKMKLANALHGYAATWQANYPRCMARKDSVAASLCISRGIEYAMKIVFMLKRQYMPYYKWSHFAMESIAARDTRVAIISELLKQAAATDYQIKAWENISYDARSINGEDELVDISEKIAYVLVNMLREQGLSGSDDLFLENQCEYIAASIES